MSSPITLYATLSFKRVSCVPGSIPSFLTSNDPVSCTSNPPILPLPFPPRSYSGPAVPTCQVGLFPGLDTECGVYPSLQCVRKHTICSVQVAHSPTGRVGTRKCRWVEEEGWCLRTQCKAVNEGRRDMGTVLGCWWGGSSLLPMFNLHMVTVAPECVGQGPCLMRLC